MRGGCRVELFERNQSGFLQIGRFICHTSHFLLTPSTCTSETHGRFFNSWSPWDRGPILTRARPWQRWTSWDSETTPAWAANACKLVWKESNSRLNPRFEPQKFNSSLLQRTFVCWNSVAAVRRVVLSFHDRQTTENSGFNYLNSSFTSTHLKFVQPQYNLFALIGAARHVTVQSFDNMRC